MPKSIALDASVIVRYLTGDDPVQSLAATELFRSASAGRVHLIIPTVILQETVYALETFYAGTPETISPKLTSLLSLNGVACPDARWVLDAIQWYRTKNSDFGDALLCAFARHHHCEVSTFDKDLIKKFTEVAAGPPPSRVKT
ncbi:MAG: type II toxin-antitoxin system VapC family toxin [Opitutaceae bacterium]|nr:type II toxin-antitoxin system VapC family toxin [Opitutaceae bacterium]MBP9913097.1 type II toxin-antitoxin system VapC family toxin [Opitutaceae bacterium]